MDMRYLTTLHAMSLISSEMGTFQAGDLEFLEAQRPWLATDRNRARRAIEAVAYGALDLVGIPRIQLPAEFVAAAIVKFVAPQNWLLACVVMEGVEWTEDIILEAHKPLSGSVLFSHCLRMNAGSDEGIEYVEAKVRNRAQGRGLDAGTVAAR